MLSQALNGPHLSLPLYQHNFSFSLLMMGQPKSGKLSVLLTPAGQPEHELSCSFHCCDFHCYGHTNWSPHTRQALHSRQALVRPVSHADCSCHILSAETETTPNSFFLSLPSFSASLFCSIIFRLPYCLTGLLPYLLVHLPVPAFVVPNLSICLPLCGPKVKRNLIKRRRSNNSCKGEMKMPAKCVEGKPDNASLFLCPSDVHYGNSGVTQTND